MLEIEISEAFLLDILNQKKFRFTLEEIDPIIPPKIKKDILDRIDLDPENLESKEILTLFNLITMLLERYRNYKFPSINKLLEIIKKSENKVAKKNGMRALMIFSKGYELHRKKRFLIQKMVEFLKWNHPI